MRWSTLIGEGFDAVLRIAALRIRRLIARRLCNVERYLSRHRLPQAAAASPSIRWRWPSNAALAYAYLLTPDTWHFVHRAASAPPVHSDRRAAAHQQWRRRCCRR